VTFTNKAADQMKDRVAALLEGHIGGQPHISTFHSFCVSVLRRHIDRLGYTRDFTITMKTTSSGRLRLRARNWG